MRSIPKKPIFNQLPLFKNKEDANALKELVKKCFVPRYVYKQHQKQNETLREQISNCMKSCLSTTGPSIFSAQNTPSSHPRPSFKMGKYLVSRKIRPNACNVLKRELEGCRTETQMIVGKMQYNESQISFKTIPTLKYSSKSTTQRSTVSVCESRKLFGHSSIFRDQ